MPTPTTAMPKTAKEILEEFDTLSLYDFHATRTGTGVFPKGHLFVSESNGEPLEYPERCLELDQEKVRTFLLSAMRAAVEAVREPYHKLPKDLKDMDAHLIITGWNAHKDKVDERTRRFFNEDNQGE